MIFAAGLGTRLKPLTDHMPKALVSVGGEPLLKRVIFRLKDAGIERIVINVHHFSEMILDYLKENHNFDMDIRISDESSMLLETGGGIKKAAPLFDKEQPVLIHNCDILSNVDLAQFYDFHGSAAATLLVSERKTKRYLVFDKDMKLVGWTNIETGEVKGEKANRLLAFSGIHVFHPSLTPLLADWPERFPIMDFYLKACGDHLIRGYEARDLQLLDVGKLDTLDHAESFIKQL
jgi:NDP-sugar pyrophosphorylase family protein